MGQFFLGESQSRLYPHMRAKFGRDPTFVSKKWSLKFRSRCIHNFHAMRHVSPAHPSTCTWRPRGGRAHAHWERALAVGSAKKPREWPLAPSHDEWRAPNCAPVFTDGITIINAGVRRCKLINLTSSPSMLECGPSSCCEFSKGRGLYPRGIWTPAIYNPCIMLIRMMLIFMKT